jgi:hypothetical protein
MIIYAGSSDLIVYPDTFKHDPDSKMYYSLIYRPFFRENSTYYIQDADVVIPNIPNGCMYECASGGITDTIEPVMVTNEGRTFDDGTVKWRTLPFTAQLGYGDKIINSIWAGDVGVLLGSSLTFKDCMTMVKVLEVPATSKTFQITNTITVLRQSGIEEQFDRTLKIGIKQL